MILARGWSRGITNGPLTFSKMPYTAIPSESKAQINKVRAFLSVPRELGEVKAFFENFGWSYLGTSISNILKGMPDQIKIEPHPSKKRTTVYLKK